MTNIKRTIFRVTIVLIIMQFIFAIGNISQAGFWGDIFGAGSSFLQGGEEKAQEGGIVIKDDGNSITTIRTPSKAEITQVVDNIYSIIFPLGVATTVIIGGVLGIKFMVASAEEKAKLKESLIPYAIGCVVIYGAFGIWKLAIVILSQLS